MRKVANALAELAPPELRLGIVEIGQLPLYNQDLDTTDPPAAWKTFRDRMHLAGAVLFVTPEYNRGIPAPLKNAIDVGSRPYGQSVWNGKPGAVVSASPGAIGGFGANHHLRQSLVFLNVLVLQQPEVYFGGADKLFDASGSSPTIARASTCKVPCSHSRLGSAQPQKPSATVYSGQSRVRLPLNPVTTGTPIMPLVRSKIDSA